MDILTFIQGCICCHNVPFSQITSFVTVVFNHINPSPNMNRSGYVRIKITELFTNFKETAIMDLTKKTKHQNKYNFSIILFVFTFKYSLKYRIATIQKS